MKKIAFMFPGVGSQYVGMGKSLYDNFKLVRHTFEEAGEVLEVDMPKMCFDSCQKDKLAKLENAQASLLTLSVATSRVYMKEIGMNPYLCAGYSLGEYSALCCAGVIDFPEALRLVKERGLIINETASTIDGTMAWVINLDSKIVEEVCEEISGNGKEVFVSAYDTPTQVSISGHTAPLMEAARKLEKKGIVYPLRLSGPFHCPLMSDAAEKMKSVLRKFQYHESTCPVIANQNVQAYTGSEDVPNNLSLQLIRPIHWRATIEYFLNREVEIAIEIGPKNVLKFLVQKNNTAIKAYTLDNDKDLKEITELLVAANETFYPGLSMTWEPLQIKKEKS